RAGASGAVRARAVRRGGTGPGRGRVATPPGGLPGGAPPVAGAAIRQPGAQPLPHWSGGGAVGAGWGWIQERSRLKPLLQAAQGARRVSWDGLALATVVERIQERSRLK